MMSTISGSVTTDAARGKSAILRNAHVQRLIKAPILDWVIPPGLVVVIVVAAFWIAFGPQ